MSNAATDILRRLRGGTPEVRDAGAALVAHLTRDAAPKVASAEAVDLETLDLDALIRLADEHGVALEPASGPATVVPEEKPASSGEVLSKAAAEKLIAETQVVYHAFAQELELAKHAAAMGLCRYCKTNPVSGASVCSVCAED